MTPKRVSDVSKADLVVAKTQKLKKCEPVKAKMIKAKVIEMCMESEVHGISHIVKDGPMFLRLMWAVFFILSNLGCCYFMYMSFCNYFNYEVVTQIRVVDEMPARFPTIGACSLNPLASDAALEYVINYLTVNNMSVDYVKSNGIGYFRYVLVSSILSSNMSRKEQVAIGPSLSEFIIDCNFNGIECNLKEFGWYFDGYYGGCYQFNPTGKEHSFRAGKINGLSLLLNIDPPTSELSFSDYSGAHIFVHNSSDLPTFFEGIDVATGFETNIVISRTFSRRLPSPYSSCQTTDQLKEYGSIFTDVFVQNNMGYSQNDCFNYCFQRRLADTCGCHDPSFRQLNFSKPACWSFKQYACEMNLYNDFFLNDVYSNCSHECPIECDTISYSTSINFANWPTSYSCQDILASYELFNETLASYVSLDQKCDQLKKTAAQVSIYYDSMQYVYIDESPKMYSQDLISQVGGTLGLFIGISFLSLVELLELGIETLLILVKRDACREVKA